MLTSASACVTSRAIACLTSSTSGVVGHRRSRLLPVRAQCLSVRARAPGALEISCQFSAVASSKWSKS
eukprot:12202083-Alexandrium_andersonii.AAC.1